MSAAAPTTAATTIEPAAPISLLRHFSRLDDPRQSGKVLYPLIEIILLVVCATIADCDDNVEICEWGEAHLAFRDGIPSHDTLGDVLAALDPAVFAECFHDWVGELRDDCPDVVAVDGKTSRRTHDRGKGKKPLHLVSAWASRQRLVLGQQATEEKSNEITAIPLLLERLMLKGSIVTIDAMGTQTEIAWKIVDKGADYCLALKDNRPALAGEVARYFADPAAEGVTRAETVDKDHGRLEVRRHAVCSSIDWLKSDRRHPGELDFPHLKMIGMVESETTRRPEPVRERRYYLCSKVMTAETFAEVVRAHWGVENSLHWCLDVTFDDDQCRLRTGHGPPHRPEPAANHQDQVEPQGAPQEGRLEPGLPRRYPARRGVRLFKRFPCPEMNSDLHLVTIGDARRARDGRCVNRRSYAS